MKAARTIVLIISIIGAAAYAPVLLLMLFAAQKQKGMLRIAAIIFFVSDLLLTFYQWKHLHMSIHIIYMGLFYLALLLFAGLPLKENTN